jgi:hypothetical protein
MRARRRAREMPGAAAGFVLHDRSTGFGGMKAWPLPWTGGWTHCTMHADADADAAALIPPACWHALMGDRSTPIDRDHISTDS